MERREKGSEQEKLLLVSDNEKILSYLSSILEQMQKKDYNTITAKTAGQALDKLEKEQPTMIVTDHQLPHGNAIDLLKEVQERAPATKRILLTRSPSIQRSKSLLDRTWDRTKILDTLAQLIKKKREREEEERSPLEKLYASEEGHQLLESLVDFEPATPTVHTIVEEKGRSFSSIHDLERRLEVLSNNHLITRKKNPPIIFKCPECNSPDYKVTVTCPFCSSRNLKKGEVIEHFPCSTTEFKTKFEQGSDLICPECGEALRQVGVDYRKVGNYLHCRECGEFFGEANVKLECNICGNSYAINEAVWSKKARIIPNKPKITKFLKKMDILSVIEAVMEGGGMYVKRNVNLKTDGSVKFDLAVYVDEAEYLMGDKPIFLADIGVHPHGLLKDSVQEFAEKREKVDFDCLFYFIASPSLSDDAYKACQELKVAYLEIEDEEMARKLFKDIRKSVSQIT